MHSTPGLIFFSRAEISRFGGRHANSGSLGLYPGAGLAPSCICSKAGFHATNRRVSVHRLCLPEGRCDVHHQMATALLDTQGAPPAPTPPPPNSMAAGNLVKLLLHQRPVLSEVSFRSTTARCVSCVSWASDGRLALGTNDGVCILSLRLIRELAYGEPRQHNRLEPRQHNRLELRQQWVQRSDEAVLRVTWSKHNAAWDGRCLLCIVWRSGTFGTYEPPRVVAHFDWVPLDVFECESRLGWKESLLEERGGNNCVRDVACGPLLVLARREALEIYAFASRHRASARLELQGRHELCSTAVDWFGLDSLIVGRSDGAACCLCGHERRSVRVADGRYVHLVKSIADTYAVIAASTLLLVVLDTHSFVVPRHSGCRPASSLDGDSCTLCACASDGELCVWTLNLERAEAHLISHRASGATFGFAFSPKHLVCCWIDRLPPDAVKRQDASTSLKLGAIFAEEDTTIRSAVPTQDLLWLDHWAARRRLDRQVQCLDDNLQVDWFASPRLDPSLGHLLAALIGDTTRLLEFRAILLASRSLAGVAQRRTRCPICDADVVCPSTNLPCDLRVFCANRHPVLLCARDLNPIQLDSGCAPLQSIVALYATRDCQCVLFLRRWICPACGVSTAASEDFSLAVCPSVRTSPCHVTDPALQLLFYLLRVATVVNVDCGSCCRWSYCLRLVRSK